jgi:hypothetical protein
MENARMATKMRIVVDNTEPNASLTPTLDLSEAAMTSERLIGKRRKLLGPQAKYPSLTTIEMKQPSATHQVILRKSP